jgi:hypothetical protein
MLHFMGCEQMKRYFRIGALATEGKKVGRYPFCKASIYRKIAQGLFPPPIVIAGTNVWSEDMLEDFERGSQQYTPKEQAKQAAARSVEARRKKRAETVEAA